MRQRRGFLAAAGAEARPPRAVHRRRRPRRLDPSRSNPLRARGVRRQRQQDGRRVPSRGPRRLYVFEARAPRTPALRAGALEPYSILLPPEFKEAPVSNARSGNYCQPRCDEATTEVQFVEPSAGSLQIIIIPTTKLLIAKQDPTVEDVGTIDGILNAISPAITGSVAAEPEEVVSSSTKVKDGRSYYEYELLTPFAEFGLHSVSAVSTNKTTSMIATIAASEKQWAKSEADLKKVIDSFRVCVK